jgi:hypothetical protein
MIRTTAVTVLLALALVGALAGGPLAQADEPVPTEQFSFDASVELLDDWPWD